MNYQSDFACMTKFIDDLPEKLKFHVWTGYQANAEAAFASAKLGKAYGYRSLFNKTAATHKQHDINELKTCVQKLSENRLHHGTRGKKTTTQ